MTRMIEPEWLDELPPDDPDAVRSRRDLCRVNGLMRHHRIMAEVLKRRLNGNRPVHIVDLGAGDGNFFLGVARQFPAPAVSRSRVFRSGSPDGRDPEWPAPKVTLLDRQKAVQPAMLSALGEAGWEAEAVVADVFEWFQRAGPGEVVVANLFLHHFYDISLAGLFRAIAECTRLFIALEPRRAFWPLLCSRFLMMAGCNCVTQHDAVLSVRAGFGADELSRLWPPLPGWQLAEQSVGPFSHLFIAQKQAES